MAKKDRTGNRKTREQKKQFKVPELGYYLIVTDTEATERCFFNGLHQALPEEVRNKLVIKVVETKTRAMIDKCLELIAYEAQKRQRIKNVGRFEKGRSHRSLFYSWKRS